MASASELILGIDFGTSYSTAGVWYGGKVEWVLDRGDPMIPSVIHVPERGNPLIGVAAQMRLALQPQNTIASIKRLLGRRMEDSEVRSIDAGVGYRIAAGPKGLAVVEIGRDTYACEQLVAMILSYLRDLAEKRFGSRIRKAVIAVPAEADPSFVSALGRAARIAHLQLLQVIPEPIAGALSLGIQSQPCDRMLAICDFGGGTFDATIVSQEGLHFTPIACHGNSFLGGDDFDEIIASEVAASVHRRCGFSMRRDVVRWQNLRRRCESAKRILSREEEARLAMTDAYVEAGAMRNIDLLLDRNWVEARWEPLMKQVDDVLARVLETSGCERHEIHEVILIGGTSLIPLVRRRIAEFFEGRQVLVNDMANVAVAYGATLHSASFLRKRGAELPELDLSRDPLAS